jgi:hypothetical protein
MGSFNVPFERDYTIFWALEYVSESNKRKDYVDNFRRYGQELKVPYYLLFDPETRDLRLHRHNGTGYDRVAPGGHGRLAVPELEVEVGVLGGWARFWYRGELLPLPAELLAQMAALEARVEEAEARARREHQRADEEHRRAEQERQQAEKERQQAEEQRRRAEEAGRREEEQREQAEQQRRQTEAERQRADLAEAELQRLRSLLAQLQGGAGPTQPAP